LSFSWQANQILKRKLSAVALAKADFLVEISKKKIWGKQYLPFSSPPAFIPHSVFHPSWVFLLNVTQAEACQDRSYRKP